jgi:Kef-type K+ transport system membrane component KefB
MIILGQFSKSIDNDFWIYLVIFCSLFSPGFEFKSEEEKKRAGKISAIIAIIATVVSIALYAAFNGMWVFNAHCWSLFIGVAVASLSISMILMFLKSNRD